MKANPLSDPEVMAAYKAQAQAEGGFRFLKDPMCFVSSLFVKKPCRMQGLLMVMTGALRVYSVVQRRLRQQLARQNETLPNQLNQPTERPTLRWVLQLFEGMHRVRVTVQGQVHDLIEGLNDVQMKILRLFGEAVCRLYQISPGEGLLNVGFMKCIYCLEDKDPEYFLKTEHVMPQSFGRFQNNSTLNGVVCDCCNKYFGDNLEINLARDTLEGVYRYQLGVKKPEEFKSVGKRTRLTREVAEGEFKGAYAYLEYSDEQGKIVLKPVPQIGLLKKDSSEYSYFLCDELPNRSALDQEIFDIDHPRAIRTLACSQELAEKVLAEKGFTFKYGGEMEPSDNDEDLLCKVEGQIDDIIRRAVAKIAFNYLERVA